MATACNKSSQFQPGNQASVGHGAPAGNTNSLRHGLRTRRKLSIGKLPKGCSWINTLVSALRRELEALTMEVHRALDFKSQLYIQSACRHEQAALLAQRWLRLQAETMTHSERLTYLQAIAKESDLRDRAVDRLRLDVETGSIIESPYASVAPTMESTESQTK